MNFSLDLAIHDEVVLEFHDSLNLYIRGKDVARSDARWLGSGCWGGSSRTIRMAGRILRKRYWGGRRALLWSGQRWLLWFARNLADDFFKHAECYKSAYRRSSDFDPNVLTNRRFVKKRVRSRSAGALFYGRSFIIIDEFRIRNRDGWRRYLDGNLGLQ